MAHELTINQLRKNLQDNDFQTLYYNLLLGRVEDLSEPERIDLLRSAILFLNFGEENLRKMGYRIILRYSNLFNDYQPLYDVSLNYGFIPVSKFIETNLIEQETRSDSFFGSLFSAFQDSFKQSEIYLSSGQKKLIEFSRNTDANFVVIAPTSYGKSEIIINQIYRNLSKKTCVIVPSKALLAQTKRRIVEHPDFANSIQRIITHPDMFRGDEGNFVAVLTQERLLRMLQKNSSLSLDLVLVDEAHNLLKEDPRSTLLSQVILILQKRNHDVILNFFTPFISDPNNLKMHYFPYEITSANTKEFIKIERFNLVDIKGDQRLYLYDQFLNTFSSVGEVVYSNDVSFLVQNKASKNIAYVNRPRDIEKVALQLIGSNSISINEELEEVYSAISDFVHAEYNLLKCIRSGIVYHHGGMPEIVRLYVENIFSKIEELQFIVTSSTLLEGVNIPAEKIFLLTTRIGRRNFTKAEFKNLIGRVCRFSEVFNNEKGSLTQLEPEIYIVKGAYAPNNANPRNFLSKHAKIDIKIKDEVNNLMLEEDVESLSSENQQKVKDALEYLENIEPNTVQLEDVTYAQSDIAKLCYSNNVYDFDIKVFEDTLNGNLESYENEIEGQINDTIGIIEAIYKIFIENVEVTEPNVARLVNEPARRFYAMILEWRTGGSSYKQMIAKFTKYWSELDNPIVFVGKKWGEIPLAEDRYQELYVDLRSKNDSQRINLAIVRIKEEQDFVDNSLMKYVEILNDLDFINQTFYDKIKYGSSDQRIICLLKNGFSMELAKIITKAEYAGFVTIDLQTDTINLNPGIIQEMENAEENRILLFEIRYHIR
jgi:hypothetical protein